MIMHWSMKLLALVSSSQIKLINDVIISGKKNSTPLLEELVPACYILLEESVREIAVELRNKKQVPILTHYEYT